MNTFESILKTISQSYQTPLIPTNTILAILLIVFLLGIYEYLIYKFVSHRAFYNRSFNICLCIIPFFISTIILCLQSNIVITLGTIGALAIIRFRTAIKDPVDMLYLLWSIHIGITCGCQLYEIAILTSLAVTIVLLLFENISIGRKPFILILHSNEDIESEIIPIVKRNVNRYKIKSRNYTQSGLDYVIEISVKNPAKLLQVLKASGIEKFSIIEYDNNDLL